MKICLFTCFCLARIRWPSCNAAFVIADLDLPGVVAEQDDVQRVLGVAGQDQLGQGQRRLLRRRDAVLSVENHGVAHVDEEHRRARG